MVKKVVKKRCMPDLSGTPLTRSTVVSLGKSVAFNSIKGVASFAKLTRYFALQGRFNITSFCNSMKSERRRHFQAADVYSVCPFPACQNCFLTLRLLWRQIRRASQ